MTIENLSDTVKTKSDQLNADDLVGGSIDVLITGIRRGSADQPIIIDIQGYMPFKPCKTVRRILIKGWGDNGHSWVGKSLRLYNDPTVKWAGVAIGGIRVSHMSDIEPFTIALNASAKHKLQHQISLLMPEDHSAIIQQYINTPQENQQALWETLNVNQQAAINAAFEQQKAK